MSIAGTPRVGVIFKSNEKLSSLFSYARRADELELKGGFWISEAHQWLRAAGADARGAFATLAAAAMNMNRVPIGMAMASPYLRHPAILASEAAALDELTDGRFVMALGASKVTTNFFEADLDRKPPLKVHREAFSIIRQALAGGQFQFVGSVFATAMPAIAPEHMNHRPNIPLFLCATGSRLQGLAGELADGLLLPSLTSPGFAASAIATAAQAMKTTGRDASKFTLAATIIMCVSEDGAKARDAVRPYVAEHIAQKVKSNVGNEMLATAGLGSNVNMLRDEVASGRRDITHLITDDMLRTLGIAAGTPDEAAAILQSLIAAGIDMPLIEIMASGEEATLAGMTQLATEIIPRLVPPEAPTASPIQQLPPDRAP